MNVGCGSVGAIDHNTSDSHRRSVFGRERLSRLIRRLCPQSIGTVRPGIRTTAAAQKSNNDEQWNQEFRIHRGGYHRMSKWSESCGQPLD